MDRQRQRGLREAGAWGASEKRAFSELQLTGLRFARRKQEGGPALRPFMFIISSARFGVEGARSALGQHVKDEHLKDSAQDAVQDVEEDV